MTLSVPSERQAPSGESSVSAKMRDDDCSRSPTKASHQVFGESLVQLIKEGKPIVTVEADVMLRSGAGVVWDSYPERVLQVGVAEQNAVGVAAGLADMDWIPFVSTFAVTLSRRAADQVWQSVCFNNANVKLHGMFSGFTAESNGATHQSLEDLAVMRAFPNLVIIEPADCEELRQAVRVAAEHTGPVYIRNIRGMLPVPCDGKQPALEIGKAVMLRPGSDVTIIASGIMVRYALKACDILASEGIGARVVNPRTIDPLDEDMVLCCAEETDAIVTVENHSVRGGLGGAVAEFLGETHPTRIRRIGVRGKFGDSGTLDWLLEAYGMDVAHIVAAAKELLSNAR